MAFFQLVRSPGEIHLFTAAGDDTAGTAVVERTKATGAHVHAVRREIPHPRDVVLVTPDCERTILVVDEPLHPRRADPLPWEILATCDAVFFTARDPALLEASRTARLLVVTARRAEALARSGVRADVVVGSALDPRETGRLADYPVPPGALVMTEGGRGGRIETRGTCGRFATTPMAMPDARGTAYGAGDSFAAALTWYLALGLALEDACRRAAVRGAAVLRGRSPLESQLDLSWTESGRDPAGTS
jgi:ribokinase